MRNEAIQVGSVLKQRSSDLTLTVHYVDDNGVMLSNGYCPNHHEVANQWELVEPVKTYSVELVHPTNYYRGVEVFDVRRKEVNGKLIRCVDSGKLGYSRDYWCDSDEAAIRLLAHEHACSIRNCKGMNQ